MPNIRLLTYFRLAPEKGEASVRNGNDRGKINSL
jgi:hypothetical protein